VGLLGVLLAGLAGDITTAHAATDVAVAAVTSTGKGLAGGGALSTCGERASGASADLLVTACMKHQCTCTTGVI